MTETKEQRKARYIRNKDREAEQNKQFRLRNPNYSKEYYNKNSEKWKVRYEERKRFEERKRL
jgi:hypothetical protein